MKKGGFNNTKCNSRANFKNSKGILLKSTRSNSASDFNILNNNFLKSKASQITIIIIISILLVVSISAIFYFSSISKKNVTADISVLSASEITNQIKEQRDNCLSEKTIFAIDAYGLDETNIQSFLSQNLAACIQPVINRYNGVAEITSPSLSVSVMINDEKIEVTGNYPISVTKTDTQNLDEFSLTLPRTISANIITNPFCQANRDYYLKSWDDKFEIFVPTGTKAQYKNGTCLDKIEIRIEDPIKTYGNRATSLTSLVYIPMPLGAEFSVNNAEIKQKYTDKDYADYSDASATKDYYILPQEDLKIQLFVPLDINNYYIYPDNPTGTRNSADTANKFIKAKVDHFYDVVISHDTSCFVTRETIIESTDRRVNLDIRKNTEATKSDGSCLDWIVVQMGPKKSNVVNFYEYDYSFFPIGAQFSPNLIYTYKYTQNQVQSSRFLYGGYNWQNLINGTWQDPRTYKPPVFSELKSEKNGNDVTFSFIVTDDITKILQCNLYINNTLAGSVNVQNATRGILIKTLNDGRYSWQIGCTDEIAEEKSVSQEVNVGNLGGFVTVFLPLSNFAKQTGYAITGFATNNPRSGLNARQIKDLRIAYYDNDAQVYRPWKTIVDTTNEKIIAKVEFFSGSNSVEGNSYPPGTGGTITGMAFFDIRGRAPITGLFMDGWFDWGGGGGDSGGVNIPAQGCGGEIDTRYAVGKLSDTNEAFGKGAASTYSYTISTDNACMEEAAISITPKVSTGDLENPEAALSSGSISSPPTEAGTYFITGAVEDIDNLTQENTLLGGTYYAWLNALISVKGIGFSSDSGREISEAEFIAAGGYNLSAWDIARCTQLYTEEKDLEACYWCANHVQEVIDKEATGESMGLRGTFASLEYCTWTMQGAACSWNAAECSGYTDYCKNAACNKCMEWCSSGAEGFGGSGTTSGSLEHCADVIEHECCPPGQTCNSNNGTYTPGNCQEMGGTYNRSTEQFLGYGLVRYWLDLSNAEVVTFADQLAANNLTATYIEYFGMDVHVARYNIINQPQNGYAKAKFLVETMRARNITTFINYINWNAPDICTNNPFTDTWFQNGLGGLIQQIGTDKVIMQTAVEGGERCTDKFTRWNNMMAGGWNGMKSYSIDGGVKTAPSAEWFISPTPGISGAFATGAIVTTDDGTTLRYFADREGQGNVDPAKLENYAGGINIPCHSGFIYYDFGYDGKKPDVGAIVALGKVAAKKSVPTPQTPPNITITSPINGHVYQTLSIPLIGSSNPANIVNVGYIINGGSLILNPVFPHNITAREGENKLEVYAQNSAGLIGNTNVTFNVSIPTALIPPEITIMSPINNGNYEISMPLNKTLLNVSSNQIITSSFWKYSLNGGITNVSFSNPSQIVVNNGENNLIVYGTNANGTGSASVNFNVLLFNPAYLPRITITQPGQGVRYTSNQIFIQTLANQTISSWRYSLNGGDKKDCSCESGDAFEALEGRNNLVIYATNENGTGSISTYFFVNTTSA